MQGRSDFKLRCLALYGVTVALEIPAILARYMAALAVAAVALQVSGHEGSPVEWARLAALGPIAWSALAFATPKGGGWWWRQRTGGREPSERERGIYERAMRQLQSGTSISLPIPEGWFVLEDPSCEAAVYGTTLMLSSGALQSGHLNAILAHELAHLQSLDAKLTVALNRLVLKPFTPPKPLPSSAPEQPPATMGLTRWALSRAIALLRGGIGLHLTAPSWAAIWREQEYAADEWAAEIGQAEPLAEFLQTHVLDLDHPIPLVALTTQTHPPTELRIDRLRNGASTPSPSTTSSKGGPSWMGEPA